MMSIKNDQLSEATKAQIESQIALFNSLTAKAVESVEKMIELNVNATRSVLDSASTTAREVLNAKDPQQAMQVSASQMQPSADRALAYSRQVSNILATTQAEFTRTVEAQIATYS
ncbi:phasin family protein, partial [Salmonella enterica]|uniref:phasin family protein n=1 Tax=Salmonella enterica TaxID=28901 RepID=UPI00122DB734